MINKPHYEVPAIQTVPARRIVELMGPVSCGSMRAPTKAEEIIRN